MRSAIGIILLFIYLALNSGLGLSFHACAGEIMEVSFLAELSKCQDEERSETPAVQRKCCIIGSIVLGVEDAFESNTFDFQLDSEVAHYQLPIAVTANPDLQVDAEVPSLCQPRPPNLALYRLYAKPLDYL